MERSVIAARGAVGGLIAGGIVAVWFLVTDIVAGSAFSTPEILGTAVFGRGLAASAGTVIAAYTLLHLAGFMVLGAAAALFLASIGASPGLMVGLVFGLGVLNAFHYGALLLGGVISQLALPPLHVMGSNLLGGMVFAAFLHRSWGSDRPIGPAAVLRIPLVRRGLTVGLLGAAAVAFWFFVLDLVTQRPFFTPSALGAAILLGADSPGQVQVAPGIVAAYTVLHLAAFAVIGVLFVWTAERMSRAPSRWLLVLMGFVVLEGLFVASVGAVVSWVLQALAWWAVLAGNLIAVTVMGWAAWAMHPELRKRLRDEPVVTAV